MGEYTHSKQAQFTKSNASCGITEMHHLPAIPPNQTLFSLGTHLYHKANPRPCAFILFSDVVDTGNPSRGEMLAAEIKKTGICGELSESSKEVNPRTGNTIRVWLLHLSHDTFRKWYQEELANRITE